MKPVQLDHGGHSRQESLYELTWDSFNDSRRGGFCASNYLHTDATEWVLNGMRAKKAIDRNWEAVCAHLEAFEALLQSMVREGLECFSVSGVEQLCKKIDLLRNLKAELLKLVSDEVEGMDEVRYEEIQSYLEQVEGRLSKNREALLNHLDIWLSYSTLEFGIHKIKGEINKSASFEAILDSRLVEKHLVELPEDAYETLMEHFVGQEMPKMVERLAYAKAQHQLMHFALAYAKAKKDLRVRVKGHSIAFDPKEIQDATITRRFFKACAQAQWLLLLYLAEDERLKGEDKAFKETYSVVAGLAGTFWEVYLNALRKCFQLEELDSPFAHWIEDMLELLKFTSVFCLAVDSFLGQADIKTLQDNHGTHLMQASQGMLKHVHQLLNEGSEANFKALARDFVQKNKQALDAIVNYAPLKDIWVDSDQLLAAIDCLKHLAE